MTDKFGPIDVDDIVLNETIVFAWRMWLITWWSAICSNIFEQNAWFWLKIFSGVRAVSPWREHKPKFHDSSLTFKHPHKCTLLACCNLQKMLSIALHRWGLPQSLTSCQCCIYYIESTIPNSVEGLRKWQTNEGQGIVKTKKINQMFGFISSSMYRSKNGNATSHHSIGRGHMRE